MDWTLGATVLLGTAVAAIVYYGMKRDAGSAKEIKKGATNKSPKREDNDVDECPDRVDLLEALKALVSTRRAQGKSVERFCCVGYVQDVDPISAFQRANLLLFRS